MRSTVMNRKHAERLVLWGKNVPEATLPSPVTNVETYLGIAEVIARRSKDPSTKVGCVLVSPDHREIASGYNGFPKSIPDYTALLNKEVMEPLSKYDLIIHAEMNAILNCHIRPEGWSLFCTHVPCAACAKMIVASGITSVTCYSQGPKTDMGCDKSALIFGLANIAYKVIPYEAQQVQEEKTGNP